MLGMPRFAELHAFKHYYRGKVLFIMIMNLRPFHFTSKIPYHSIFIGFTNHFEHISLAPRVFCRLKDYSSCR